MTGPIAALPFPVAPAELRDRLPGHHVAVPEALRQEIARTGAAISDDAADRAEAGRDWWPLGIGWAAHGQVASRPELVVRPTTTHQVSSVLRACSAAGVPITPAAGRSGVCGGAVPLYGGIALDLTGLTGPIAVDETSLVARVPAGTFGPDLEAALRQTGPGYTLGHWPQSVDLSTVGGWLACRSAGQYSTRYGKIEDLVAGVEVILADGTLVETGTAPRAATGPDLTQLFVGSEGTLGVITSAWLRIRPLPPAEGRRAFGFTSFERGLDACRLILRRGATPAVLRLYDATESARAFGTEGMCVLVVLDEADPGLLAATLAVVDEECGRSVDGSAGATLDVALVEQWLAHRNDVSALAPLWQAGIVVDTVEVAAPWELLSRTADQVLAALHRQPGLLSASVHQSHAYPDGGCLYFTFAGREPGDRAGSGGGAGTGDLAWQEEFYRSAWDAVIDRVTKLGGAISHHHGIGLNRARFLPEALGAGFGVLSALKRALDPAGILNPGKLGFESPFGAVPWP